MAEPIAFFLTWNTYGTWLPGDSRGWVEYRRGWQLPDPVLERENVARMTEDACRLTAEQRVAVERQIAETCQHRQWHLHAVNCRSNHVHVVVSAPNTSPRKLRCDLKAWATRCLNHDLESNRKNWWAQRGSIRHIDSATTLETCIRYTTQAQDRKTGPRSCVTTN
ncbi:MAG: transposase [Planctomycetaceae bacterium]|nr:transposase [Planctomycetaceae bacterium]